MTAVLPAEVVPERARPAATVVEELQMTVVEGESAVDIGEIQGALALVVKWAVRAHLGRSSSEEHAVAICDGGDTT